MGTTQLTIGIVGAGGIAGAHADAVSRLGDLVQVTGVVDPVAEARQGLAERTGAPGFATFDEMLLHGTPQAIIVCTPPSVRLEIVERALAGGIAVLAEKPIAHTLQDAQRLAEVADAHSSVVSAMAYCHRFAPAVVRMKEMIGDGAIGRLTRFENCFACHFPAMKDKWMSDPESSGGGSFIDTGCHALDTFRYLVGPAVVEALVTDHEWAGRGESSATCLVRCPENGVAGSIFSGWLEPARFTFTLVGTEGMLSYDYMAPEQLVRHPSEGEPEIIAVETHEVRFTEQLRAFARAVLEGAPSDLATFEDGLRVAEDVDSALMHGSKII